MNQEELAVSEELALEERIAKGQRQLMDPEHPLHPAGDKWRRNFSKLREMKRRLAEMRGEAPAPEETSEYQRLLLERGYVAMRVGETLVAIVWAEDTPLPEHLQSAVRFLPDDWDRLKAFGPKARRELLVIWEIFPGARFVNG